MLPKILVGISLLFGTTVSAQQKNDGIFYSSLNNAVQLGQFDGVATLKELKQHGNFALGSQHGLQAELVMIDGRAYRISAEGPVTLMNDGATLPFAAAKMFNAEKKWLVSTALTMQQLQTWLDSNMNTNMFTAIKITGEFATISYKCYYPQQKPYKPIKEVPVKMFDSSNIKGTIVGFFTPKSAMVLNSPNYHFHFLNSSATSGGHVEGFLLRNVTVEIDYANYLELRLPSANQVKDINLNEPIKQ